MQSPPPIIIEDEDWDSWEEYYDPGACLKPPWYDSDDEVARCEPGPYPRLKLRWYGNQLACWPSTGGFWLAREVHPVMLKHMGVIRFEESWRSNSSAEDDELCKQMRLFGIGAAYYPSPEAYVGRDSPDYWWRPDERPSEESHRQAQGILDNAQIVMCRLPGGEGWVMEDVDGSGKVHNQARNAVSMEEICDLIKEHGGKYFTNVTEAPQMQKHLAAVP